MAYYYPEGNPGPVCDPLMTDWFNANPKFAGEEDPDPWPDPEGWIYPPWLCETGVCPPTGPPGMPPPFIRIGRKCKVAPDGTLFDCHDEYTRPYPPSEPWDPGETFGLSDTFFTPIMDVDSCSPFDNDINIKPKRFYRQDGTYVLKSKRAKSSPVTFNVDSPEWWNDQANHYSVWVNPEVCTLPGEPQTVTYLVSIPVGDSYGFTFGCDMEGQVILNDDSTALINAVGGNLNTGTYTTPYTATTTLSSGTLKVTVNVTNDFGWRDRWWINPAGIAWRITNNDGGAEIATSLKCTTNANEGTNTTNWLQIGTPNNPAVPWTQFLKDYAIYSVKPADDIVDPYLNTWQFAETTIDIASEITVTFQVESDNDSKMTWIDPVGNLLINKEVTYTNGMGGETFTLTLIPGTHLIKFEVRNRLVGDPYAWADNPGGWYLLICRGAPCTVPFTPQWLRSGPHPAWSDFMDQYAVYPSNTETQSGITHNGCWTATVTNPSTMILEVQADNWAEFIWDGTNIGSIGQNVSPFNGAFTTSTFFTINNVAAGGHELCVNCLNGTGNDDWATNPGGMAFKMTDSLGNVILTSLDLFPPTSDIIEEDHPNLLWHTRMASGYEYYELEPSCVPTGGITTAGYARTTKGYLKFNDGFTLLGNYITSYIPTWLTMTIKTGYTYQQVFDQIVSSYATIISRKPEADGFDYWVDSFKNNSSWTLSDLNNAISVSANLPTNGELLLHTAHNGVEGNYNECNVNFFASDYAQQYASSINVCY